MALITGSPSHALGPRQRMIRAESSIRARSTLKVAAATMEFVAAGTNELKTTSYRDCPLLQTSSTLFHRCDVGLSRRIGVGAKSYGKILRKSCFAQSCSQASLLCSFKIVTIWELPLRQGFGKFGVARVEWFTGRQPFLYSDVSLLPPRRHMEHCTVQFIVPINFYQCARRYYASHLLALSLARPLYLCSNCATSFQEMGERI